MEMKQGRALSQGLRTKVEGLKAKERSQTAMDGPSKARMNREDGRTGDLKGGNRKA